MTDVLLCKQATAGRRPAAAEHWPEGSHQVAEKQAQVASTCLHFPSPYLAHDGLWGPFVLLPRYLSQITRVFIIITTDLDITAINKLNNTHILPGT